MVFYISKGVSTRITKLIFIYRSLVITIFSYPFSISENTSKLVRFVVDGVFLCVSMRGISVFMCVCVSMSVYLCVLCSVKIFKLWLSGVMAFVGPPCSEIQGITSMLC